MLFAARTTLPANLSEADAHAVPARHEGLDMSISIHREFDGGEWFVQCVSQFPLDDEILNTVHKGPWAREEIQDMDWLAASYKQFPAFSVGPFFIYGSHHEDAVPDGQMGLLIDAATAFGSGEHGTTKGCLLAMLDLNEAGVCPWNVLDMGTGSGILGIAAWKLWKTPVLAVDNDEEAVRVACRHREMNNVPSGDTGMICKAGEGFQTPAVREKRPFDLIIANILAVTLKEMVMEIKGCSDNNGYVILSGILNKQAQEVLDVYEPQGFKLAKRYDIDDWSTLVLQNTAF
jgi:ribosomal protein L11 methyltransferase